MTLLESKMPSLPEVHNDGAIILYETMAGTWEAKDKDGKGICSGLVKDDVLFWARNHLYGPLPGVETYVSRITFDSVKL